MGYLLIKNEIYEKNITKLIKLQKDDILNIIPQRYIKAIVLFGDFGKEEAIIFDNILLSGFRFAVFYDNIDGKFNFYKDAMNYIFQELVNKKKINSKLEFFDIKNDSNPYKNNCKILYGDLIDVNETDSENIIEKTRAGYFTQIYPKSILFF